MLPVLAVGNLANEDEHPAQPAEDGRGNDCSRRGQQTVEQDRFTIRNQGYQKDSQSKYQGQDSGYIHDNNDPLTAPVFDLRFALFLSVLVHPMDNSINSQNSRFIADCLNHSVYSVVQPVFYLFSGLPSSISAMLLASLSAHPLQHFSITFHHAAEVAAEAVFVHLLAGLHVPQATTVG